MLTELRRKVAEVITEGTDIYAAEYVAETITPPCAVVVPSEPYLLWGRNRRGEQLTFANRVAVGLDVLVIAHRDASVLAAEAIDEQTETIAAALTAAGYTISEVAQPGLVQLSGSRFLGTVIRIDEEIQEP